ncbi:hypothetical protein UFOVP384_21 [uncultured Caudovirales phage]|uniref:Uncharacterized protein n=1 Tax=uncultured Caudovirales phage TaxID=2100421 RepID=A0A6J7WZ27_9CAUD|nr:hypothetical protein UFOVP384_21 [uncultured Caudovirales phage]
MENLQLNNFNESIAYCEAMGLSKCLAAYADECSGEGIMAIGFNPNSGYVYIALENGISICSSFANTVEFLVTDSFNGNEEFYETYEEAEENVN